MAMKPSLAMNVGVVWDPSHGACRDVDQAFRSAGLGGFVLLSLCVHNLAHGPEKDEGMRYGQLRDSLRSFLQCFAPESSQLFQHHAPKMVEELSGSLDITNSGDALHPLWDFLLHRAEFMKKGTRVSLCRFMAWLRASRSLLTEWSMTLFSCEWLSLEHGFLQGKALQQKLLVKASVLDEAEALQTTSSSIPQLDGKVFKSCCQNAVAIACLFLNEYRHKRTMSIMVAIAGPVDEFHGTTNAFCKSAANNSEWVVKTVGGDFMQHLFEIIRALDNPATIRTCGFMSFQGMNCDDRRAMVFEGEAYADLVGSLALNLISARLRRTLYLLCSWPGKTFKLLLDDATANTTIAEFKVDLEVFQALSLVDPMPPPLKKVLQSSPFCMTVNKQWAAGFAATGWQVHEQTRELAKQRSLSHMSTQVVEDSFGVMENSPQVRGSKTFRKPQRSMAIVVERRILDERHGFEVPPANIPLARRSVRLEKSAFGVGAGSASVDLRGVASTTPQADWFSPSPANIGLPAADLPMLKHLHARGGLHDMHLADLGLFAKPEHLIVFKRDPPHPDPFGWHIGLWHYPGSSVLAWPVDILPMEGCENYQRVAMRTNLHQPSLLVVMDWAPIKVMRYLWRAWSWQCEHMKRASAKLNAAIRMIVSGVEMPLAEAAAKSAWWMMDLPALRMVSAHLQLQVAADADLVDTLVDMTSQVLKKSPEESLKIVAQRLGQQEVDKSDCVDELLEVGEASAVLTPEDEAGLKREQTIARERAVASKAFATQYRQQVQERRAASAKAQAQPSGARSRAKAKAKAAPAPRSMPTAICALSQSDIRQLMPPDSHIWKYHWSSSWCGSATVAPVLAQLEQIWRRVEREARRQHRLAAVVRPQWVRARRLPHERARGARRCIGTIRVWWKAQERACSRSWLCVCVSVCPYTVWIKAGIRAACRILSQDILPVGVRSLVRKPLGFSARWRTARHHLPMFSNRRAHVYGPPPFDLQPRRRNRWRYGANRAPLRDCPGMPSHLAQRCTWGDRRYSPCRPGRYHKLAPLEVAPIARYRIASVFGWILGAPGQFTIATEQPDGVGNLAVPFNQGTQVQAMPHVW